jgi:hypothetical protein
MRSKTLVYVVVAAAALFASGIAVGQRAVTSKFAKYLQLGNRTEMDLVALEVDMNLIRASVPTEKGIFIPHVSFNYKEDRPEAAVYISSEFEKASLDTVKSEILTDYLMTYNYLKPLVPELTEDDFVLKVVRMNNPEHKLFAECRHGNIVFH